MDIKTIRKVAGIRQGEIAKFIGMDRSNYCNFENGRYIPVTSELIKKNILQYLKDKLSEKIYTISIDLNRLTRIKDEVSDFIENK